MFQLLMKVILVCPLNNPTRIGVWSESAALRGVAAADNMAARNKVSMACLRAGRSELLVLLLSLYYYCRFGLRGAH